MTTAMRHTGTMRPGQVAELCEWVMSTRVQIERPRRWPIGSELQKPPTRLRRRPRVTRLRMGRAAFMYLQERHASFGLLAVDYCDGVGPRVRICGLVAEPTDELEAWEIELE